MRLEATERVTNALPAIVSLIQASGLDLPTHDFEVKLVFSGGKCLSGGKIDITGASGIPARVAQSSPARANLKIGSSTDPRVPPAGFKTTKATQGVTWTIVMGENGVATATAIGHESITGSLGQIGRLITEQDTCNPYDCFGLGGKGEVWSESNKRWTRAFPSATPTEVVSTEK